MNNVVNYCYYVDDFENLVLPEFKSRAEELLYDFLKSHEAEESLEMVVDGEMCRDGLSHSFCFYIHRDVEFVEETGEYMYAYSGCRS